MRLDIADAASGASRIIGEDFLRLDIADAASGASRIIGEDACASILLTRPLVPRGSLVRTLAPRCHVSGRIDFFCLFCFLFFFLVTILYCVRISAEASCAAQNIETRSGFSLFVEEGFCASLTLSALFSA